jgi:alkylation response protein AidB-like acyl-CoA dehydrogenase
MPREVFEKMGGLGMLGMALPEEYSGAGNLITVTTWCCRKRQPARW